MSGIPTAPRVRGAVTIAVLAFLVAGVAWAPAAARAAKNEAPSSPKLDDLGRSFEQQRLLAGADRVAALEKLESSATWLAQHGESDDERLAARMLSAAVQDELQNWKGAAEEYGRASDEAKNGPLGDDAAFGAIEALESQGRDADAAREWAKWLKRYPTSPLTGEAQLRMAWNAIRRGAAPDAANSIHALLAAAPWRQGDPRVALARAAAFWLADKPDDALAALGPKPQGAAATYLRALCLERQGKLLQAAALFQESAERYPGSPIRDQALLAKANTFLAAGDARSAAEEFASVAARVHDPGLKAEAELRSAGAVFLTGRTDSAFVALNDLTTRYANTDVGARAQFLKGEVLVAQGKSQEAIIEYNRILTNYFQHSVAASAQYRVARCLDRLGRKADATGAYEAVVSGYALEPEAPAAAYLAGVGLLDQNKPLAAAPYFQIVLDRYAPRGDSKTPLSFATPERQELVEAALCLLEMSYHRAGDLGQLSGAPHLLLQRMPPGKSAWRAWAMLIDADAQAAQARYPEAQAELEQVTHDFPQRAVSTAAAKLLAWTYARQGRDSLAIATEERLLATAQGERTESIVSAALLDIAHERFNQRRYKDAAAAYEDFLHRYPGHPQRLVALYQAGLSYLRLNRAGDAVDRWEAIVRDSAGAKVAERAWARMGDVYFEAEKYTNAKRCYQGLLDHFAGSSAAALATLRLAQCEYNAGHDAEAIQGFAQTEERFPNTPSAREAKRGTELALYRLSQQPNGTQVLAKLIEQFPTSSFAADAQLQVARRAYQEKRWADAADGFRRVVSGFPGYSGADQAQFLMADAYASAGKPDDARQAYTQFLSFFPESNLRPTVEFRLGLGYFAEKDFMHAAVQFTQVLAESASADMRSASRYNLALCQRQLGNGADARAELEKYGSEWPNDSRAADVAYQLGDLDDTEGNHDAALAAWQRVLAMNPRPALAAEVGYRIGFAREQAGQIDPALKAYRAAAATGGLSNPFRLSALARSAALLERRHEYTKALAAYREIVANAKDRELAAAATEKVAQLEEDLRRH